MYNSLTFIFAAMAGICLIGGLAVLKGGLDNIIYMLDEMLDTKRKRHITGGILLSISALFGGLAITVMSIGKEE